METGLGSFGLLSAFLESVGEARDNPWPGQLGGTEEGGLATFDAINGLESKISLQGHSLLLLQVPFDPTDKGL